MSKKNSKELRKGDNQAELEETEQQMPDGGGAPLLVHLQALRRVLIVSAAAVAIAFFLVFYLAIETLMSWIIGPIAERGIEIIYTAMSEALVTKFKVAIIAALMDSMMSTFSWKLAGAESFASVISSICGAICAPRIGSCFMALWAHL